MAKLHFFYSVMNAGKSMELLRARENYAYHRWQTIVFTSALDDRFGTGRVTSRAGMSAEAIAIGSEQNLFDIVREKIGGRPHRKTRAVVLADEVQFFTPEQISQLADIADGLRLPVLAYGLKNNAFGTLFSPAVASLLALADDIKEVKSMCHCGRKATMILRFDAKGRIARGGDIVQVGAESSYMSVCRLCFAAGDIGATARAGIEGFGEFTAPVVCMTCDEVFTSIDGFDGQQAYGCAAEVTHFGVSGAYGSTKIDNDVWNFKDARRPMHVNHGTICDGCIQKLMDDGTLVREEFEYPSHGDEVSEDDFERVEDALLDDDD